MRKKLFVTLVNNIPVEIFIEKCKSLGNRGYRVYNIVNETWTFIKITNK